MVFFCQKNAKKTCFFAIFFDKKRVFLRFFRLFVDFFIG